MNLDHAILDLASAHLFHNRDSNTMSHASTKPCWLTTEQNTSFLSVYLSAKRNLDYLLQIKWSIKASQSCKFHPTYKTVTSNVKFEFNFIDRDVFVRIEINYLVVNQPSRHSPCQHSPYSYPSNHGPKLIKPKLLLVLLFLYW